MTSRCKYLKKPTFIFWAALMCHVWVALSSTVLLCPSALSTQSSIIPSINHDTDGLSGVSVRTEALPLLQPYHYHCSTPFPPPFTSQEPHKRHIHVHTSWPPHLHQMGKSYYHNPVGKTGSLDIFFLHMLRQTHHERVAKCVKFVCLRGSFDKKKPPKRAVCIWSLGPVRTDNWWCFHYKVWGNVGAGAQNVCVCVYG